MCIYKKSDVRGKFMFIKNCVVSMYVLIDMIVKIICFIICIVVIIYFIVGEGGDG